MYYLRSFENKGEYAGVYQKLSQLLINNIWSVTAWKGLLSEGEMIVSRVTSRSHVLYWLELGTVYLLLAWLSRWGYSWKVPLLVTQITISQ